MPPLLQAVHPVLEVRDLAASLAFYRRLGFALAFQDSENTPLYAGLRRDAVELHVQWHDAAEWREGAQRPNYRFLVTDVEGFFAELRDAGVLPEGTELRDTAWGTREFHLHDPDHNGLQFYRERTLGEEPPPMSPQTPAEVLAELLSLERAALTRWLAGDPSGFLELCAPDVSYFDPYLAHRIDGLAALTAYYEALRGKIHAPRFEILDPRVHAGVDLAVLAFNFVSYGANDVPLAWNCTETYRRAGGPARWQIVQTHWSLTKA